MTPELEVLEDQIRSQQVRYGNEPGGNRMALITNGPVNPGLEGLVF